MAVAVSDSVRMLHQQLLQETERRTKTVYVVDHSAPVLSFLHWAPFPPDQVYTIAIEALTQLNALGRDRLATTPCPHRYQVLRLNDLAQSDEFLWIAAITQAVITAVKAFSDDHHVWEQIPAPIQAAANNDTTLRQIVDFIRFLNFEENSQQKTLQELLQQHSHADLYTPISSDPNKLRAVATQFREDALQRGTVIIRSNSRVKNADLKPFLTHLMEICFRYSTVAEQAAIEAKPRVSCVIS